MTDEEKAEEYADKILFDSKYPFIFNKEKVKAYIIKVYLDSLKCCEEAYNKGLKAGREIEREYVKNNAFTSMKEQGLFPFVKWHNLKKNSKDLPDACMNIINQDGEKVRYDYVNKVWRTDDANDYICDTPIAWCEIPTFKE